jgi:hypothetical protein
MEEVSSGRTRVLVVDPSGQSEVLTGVKAAVADKILDRAARMVR